MTELLALLDKCLSASAWIRANRHDLIRVVTVIPCLSKYLDFTKEHYEDLLRLLAYLQKNVSWRIFPQMQLAHELILLLFRA